MKQNAGILLTENFLAYAQTAHVSKCPMTTSTVTSLTCLTAQPNLIQPSSAVAERVFSILNNTFTDRQDNTLQDYLESSVMLQYNR